LLGLDRQGFCGMQMLCAFGSVRLPISRPYLC
jgi:hypothetical protein